MSSRKKAMRKGIKADIRTNPSIRTIRVCREYMHRHRKRTTGFIVR
jgi:hypothetical protein